MAPVKTQGRLWCLCSGIWKVERYERFEDFCRRQVLRLLGLLPRLLQQGQGPGRPVHCSASAENRLWWWLRKGT